MQQQFDLHPLAIEDAGKAHQRPKLERHGDALFVVARTAQMVDGHVAFGETHIFVGHGYVVSVRHGASTSYTAVRQRCETSPQVLAHGEDYILYSILDFIVDNYQPVLEAIHAEVEQLEDRVFDAELTAGETQRLFGLRRDLLRLRNAAGPLVDVCRGIEHAELSTIDQALMPLFRDVTDHVNRVNESIDALREVLAFAFEASLMIGQAPPDRDHPPTRRLGGHSGGADRDRGHLRHELRTHAGAQNDLRLSARAHRHTGGVHDAVCALPPQRLAVTCIATSAAHCLASSWNCHFTG